LISRCEQAEVSLQAQVQELSKCDEVTVRAREELDKQLVSVQARIEKLGALIQFEKGCEQVGS